MILHKIISSVIIIGLFAACSDDSNIPEPNNKIPVTPKTLKSINIIVPEIDVDKTTRSSIVDENDKLAFMWKNGDHIKLMPLKGTPIDIAINSENEGSSSVIIPVDGLSLSALEKYAVCYSLTINNEDNSIKKASFDYTRQNQNNFYNYDYLTTEFTQAKDDNIVFNMKHMSAILKIEVDMPAESFAHYGTLIVESPAFGVEGTISFSESNTGINIEKTVKSIQTDSGKDISSETPWKYTVYMMIPPTDLSGKEITFHITSSQGHVYQTKLEGRNFESGKAYLLTGKAVGASIKNKNLIENIESTYNFTFEKKNGEVDINNPTNLTLLQEVDVLVIHDINDSNVCDEIGYLTNLESLVCDNCNILSLNTSLNRNLKYLSCNNNKLTTLDLSSNNKLETLICEDNLLSSLDICNNQNLVYLDCKKNEISSLDVSHNKFLTGLVCDNNHLTSLDITNNTKLNWFSCKGNQLTFLDLSKNPVLKHIDCSYNKMTLLDVSNNTQIETLICSNNQITKLEGLKNCTNLSKLDCTNNKLSSNSELNTRILGEAIKATALRWSNLDIEQWAGHISTIYYINNYKIYVPSNNIYVNRWIQVYNSCNQLNVILDSIENNYNDYKNIYNVAKLWQCYLMYLNTTCFGEIPYSDYFQRPNESEYVYDKEKNIYTSLLKELKEIADSWAEGIGSDYLGYGDYIYNGDIKKWQKFCNSLRLKIAIQISNVYESSKLIVEEILNNSTKYPVITNNDENVMYRWQGHSSGNYEPWYDNYRTRDDDGMSQIFIEHLKKMEDPRLFVYAKRAKSDGQYRGMENGALREPYDKSIYSRIGTRFREIPNGFTPFYCANETYFMIAEAALKGWQTPMKAKEAYETGVELNMRENGISNENINTYLSGKGTWDDTLEKLYFEEWVSFFKQGISAWTLYRRTGYPTYIRTAKAADGITPQYPGARAAQWCSHNDVPFRFPYPNREFNNNAQNVEAASIGIIDYVWGKQLWWDKRKGVH